MNYDAIIKIISLFVESISTLLSSGATVFLACVAIYGINAWRREFKGKRDIELAEEVLELFYKARDAIKAIRSPLGYSREGKKVIERRKADGEEEDLEPLVATVLERYEKYEDVFHKLQTLQYRFMARFGKDKIKPFDELRECVNSIFMAAQMISVLRESLREGGLDSESKKSQREERMQYQSDLYCIGHKNDRISPKVESAVKEIEEICQKIIGGG
jgi:hypothetical protein